MCRLIKFCLRLLCDLDTPLTLLKSSPKDQEFAQQSAILKAAAECVAQIKDGGGKDKMEGIGGEWTYMGGGKERARREVGGNGHILG